MAGPAYALGNVMHVTPSTNVSNAPQFSGFGFIALMSVICALSPFAMSLLVPSFPNMGRDFGLGVDQTQLMVSAFLLGLGLSQPLHGALADRYGRRPVLLAGFAIFTLASLACFITESWTALVICRFLQAVGVSAGTVTSRAIINDVQPREQAAISLSYVSMAMGLGPIIAPVLGGIGDSLLGWRSLFAGCAGVGGLIILLAISRLKETRPEGPPRPLPELMTGYKRCLTSRVFWGYTMMFGFGQGVFFAFLPVAPDYFEFVLGRSTSVFVMCWIGLSLCFMAGSFAGTRLVKRFGMDRLLPWAGVYLIAMAAFYALTYFVFDDTVLASIIPIGLSLIATGLICPIALTGSISAFSKNAGIAAGLSSAIGLVIGGLFSVVAGQLYNMTMWPIIALVALAALGNMLGTYLSRSVS